MKRVITCGAALAAMLSAAPADAQASPPTVGRIAYSLGAVLPDPDPDGHSQIYTIKPDGTGNRQLTHLTAPDQAGDPSFSPDGKRLLYVSNAGGGAFQVWTMHADGTGQHKLIDDPDFDAFLPRWSPHGGHLVFTRCEFVFGFLECTIATAHIDGTHLKNLTGGHNVDLSASYGPSEYVAFSSNRRNSLSAIWRTTGTPPGPRRLTPPNPEAFWPDVSPDGGRILYTDNFERPESRQHSIAADGTDDRTLTPGCFGRWSPNGAFIVYDGGLNCDGGLTVAQADGSHASTILATDDLVLADWGPKA